MEWGRMGPALGSLGSWGRGGGRIIPAAGSRRPRGRAESRSGRPALPFLLVADAEAACGEAAPGPHQPQPGGTEAAAAGADPRPGQFFLHHRTPPPPSIPCSRLRASHLGGDICCFGDPGPKAS